MCTTTTASEEKCPKHDDASAPPNKFANPIGEGADPWCVCDAEKSRYLWCKTDGDRAIVIHVSERLTSMGAGSPHCIWNAPDSGPASHQVWAPELHKIQDKWYIYFSASPMPHSEGEEGHRIFVLESKTTDPLGEYELHGPLETGNGQDSNCPSIWAIDLTVLHLNNNLYAVWSGWDVPTTRQYLYIAEMQCPTRILGPRVQLCHNEDYEWERIGPDSHGLNEGPQVFQTPHATCITYSCGVSCRVTYKLGMLEYRGGDALLPESWCKRNEPVFDRTETVYGVGHSCFVPSLNGKEWWHIFHAKQDEQYGWRRAIHAQRITLDKQGFPVLGRPIEARVLLDRPSSESLQTVELPTSLPLDDIDRQPWQYFGHQQYIEWEKEGVHIGRIPVNPTNAYRSGEKLVLGADCPNDVMATATFDFVSEYQGNAGIVVRCTAPAVGYHAFRGYYIAVDPMARSLFIGKMDGSTYTELSRRDDVTVDMTRSQVLAGTVCGDSIDVHLNGEKLLSINDTTFQTGSVGIRVCDTHALFTKFDIVEATVHE